MGRRIKKPQVKPEMRKQWLRRFEEEGQSPPQIAKADSYDVRTVRKQIELARQERENREARFAVLRQALEMHYADLVDFVQKLKSSVISSTLPLGAKSDPLWAALREHLPRSPIWKAMDRMERLNDELSSIEKRAEERLWGEVERRSPVSFAARDGETGLHPNGLAGAMSYHLRAEKSPQVLLFKTHSMEGGLSEVAYGGWTCAVVSHEQVPAVKELIANLMLEVGQWSEREDMRRTLVERHRVTEAISGELTTIILRRVLPGRCKYCPI